MSLPSNRNKVALLRKSHPDWTLKRIADDIGITKERVRQLLVILELPTKHVKQD